jgi:hypothetical protein
LLKIRGYFFFENFIFRGRLREKFSLSWMRMLFRIFSGQKIKMKKTFIHVLPFVVAVLTLCRPCLAIESKDVWGRWLIESFSEIDMPEDQKTFYFFDKNGTFTKKMIVADYVEEQAGKWKIEGKSIVITFPGKNTAVIYEASLEGGKLILKRMGMSTTLRRENE